MAALYEMRTYRCMPGRMPEVLDRFATSLVGMFDRHGFDTVGYWTVAVGGSSNDLIYMLRWKSMDDCEQGWARFGKDPEWPEVKARTESNGPIVESITTQFLKPTAFSPVA